MGETMIFTQDFSNCFILLFPSLLIYFASQIFQIIIVKENALNHLSFRFQENIIGFPMQNKNYDFFKNNYTL